MLNAPFIVRAVLGQEQGHWRVVKLMAFILVRAPQNNGMVKAFKTSFIQLLGRGLGFERVESPQTRE